MLIAQLSKLGKFIRIFHQSSVETIGKLSKTVKRVGNLGLSPRMMRNEFPIKQ